jgi:hypothetical protein
VCSLRHTWKNTKLPGFMSDIAIAILFSEKAAIHLGSVTGKKNCGFSCKKHHQTTHKTARELIHNPKTKYSAHL